MRQLLGVLFVVMGSSFAVAFDGAPECSDSDINTLKEAVEKSDHPSAKKISDAAGNGSCTVNQVFGSTIFGLGVGPDYFTIQIQGDTVTITP